MGRMVPVEGIRQHLEVLDRAQSSVGYELSRVTTVVASPRSEPPIAELMMMAVVLLIPLGFLGLWFFRSRKSRQRKSEFVRELIARPGATPETALPVATQEQFDSVLENSSCKCGQRVYDRNSPPKLERFTYDGQRLVGVQLHCSSCKQSNDLYLNPLFENQGQHVADLSTG
jgi:hypothetical protein